MPQKSLLVTNSSKTENDKRRQLILTIKKKRKELRDLIVKVEMLKVSLQLTENEYTVKVGSLFLKDNHLDLEIIRLRNILHLMEEGLTQKQAIDQIAKTYYAKQLELEEEKIKVRREEELFHKREEKVLKPSEDIKKLWKKLISRFHPDLVQDNQEKIKRDKIMKLINRAYQECDYDQLMKIDRENLPKEENTIDNLEEILESVLYDIAQQSKSYRELESSQWYKWMQKINAGKKRNINIFEGIEKQLLRDISTKISILNGLKSQITKKGIINPSK